MAATCARNGFKAFSLSMMAIKAMNSVTASPGQHTAYVKNDGDLCTTGKNSDGQLGPPSPSWINAQPGAAANWWTSRWFGNFYLNTNGWIRHEQLGWVFPMESPTAGLWLWKRELGWLWTDKEIYPFLYKSSTGGWHYFYGNHEDTLFLYDYSTKRWITLLQK